MAAFGKIRDRLQATGGFTLIELLLAASITLIVIGGGITVLVSSLRSEPRIAERTADIQGARVAMERLTREIRQGAIVTAATSSQFTVVTNVNSATCGGAQSDEVRPCLVTYSCSQSACTRREANPDGTAPGPVVTVVEGVSTASVFSFSPSASAPTHVGIKLEFPGAAGDDSITLTDGATMRNAGAS